MSSTLTPEMRECVSKDPFFERSCLSGKRGNIVIHHCLKFAGKQIQLPFNIVPLLQEEHDNDPKSVHRCLETRERVELICLNRASEEEIERFGLAQKKKYLQNKYK
jgi:hypothetical protein